MICSNKEQNMATGNDRVLAQNSAARNRAAKARILLCLIGLGFGVCFGFSLPVPDTIMLPDSLGPIRPPYHLAFGSSTDNIYVASESSDIIVVDGNTFQRIKRINTGTPVGGALLVSQHNKLYCSYPQQGRIGIIDCSTNTIVGSIQVGTWPTLLCYSSGSDKLYCGDTVDRTVSVIDCATDGVLKVIPVGDSLTAMVYDSTTSKVYAATEDAVRAISCSADSIVATISAVKHARGFCINQHLQKLYVVGSLDDHCIYVVSIQSDSLIATMPCGDNQLTRPVCNEVVDRLYTTCGDDENPSGNYLLEYDCLGDTLTRSRFKGTGTAEVGLVCDAERSRLYDMYMDEIYNAHVLVVDCTTLDRISTKLLGCLLADFETEPARHRIMFSAGHDDFGWEVAAIDYRGDSTYWRGAAPLSGWAHDITHNPAGRLYYGWQAGLGVVDEQTNRVVNQIHGCTQAYSRTSHKFYGGAWTGLDVMDGTNDSLLKPIEIGSGASLPCWSPGENKVYCAANTGARMFIAAVDCLTDSVVRTIDNYDIVKWFEHLGQSRMLCVDKKRLLVLDCRTDSVLVDSGIEGVYASTSTCDGEKVYLARPGWLEVRSSDSLSLLTAVKWLYFNPSGRGTFLTLSDTTHKLYWFVGDSALAINTDDDAVVARMHVHARDACLDHTGRYMFCACYDDRSLKVYDTQTDSLVAVYPHVPQYPVDVRLTTCPELGRIYVSCRDVILVYSDAPSGVNETSNAEVQATGRMPTVVRDVLLMPEAVFDQRLAVGACLSDVSGRTAMTLRQGANDLRGLAPGVYFVQEPPQTANFKSRTLRKIVIAR
jgi:YVTN family beta-propeller protein